MRKFLSAFALLLAFAAGMTLQAKAPNGYYTGISGLTDSALKTKLHEIIKNNSTNSYTGLFKQSFCYTDVRDDGTWWDMYSNISRYVRNGWSGMNREHSFPKSWWGGDENPAYTDLNHLYPSDGDANLAKNNYPLGEVKTATFDNGLVKVGNPVAGQGGGNRYVFEPADEYKGDFARTYFYMVTRYQDLTWKYTYMAQNGAYPSLQGWAVELLLKWHRQDPVSDKETARNDEVYRLQYNRNPFIDYPNLVEYIWGTMKGKPFTDSDLPPAGEGTLISPENGSTVSFGEVAAGHSKKMTVNIRGSLSANLSLMLYGEDKQDFSIPVTSIPWTAVNESGYELDITYSPKSVGGSDASLLLYDGGLQGVTSYTVKLNGTACAAPVFDRITATEATKISDTGFQANWQTPANPETVDYYTVNISEYLNGSVSTVSVATDGNEPYLYYSDTKSGASYSYTVQSVRLDMKSPESNVIYVSLSGISDAGSFRPLAVAQIGKGVRFICSETHTNVRITDLSGRTIAVLPEVADGHCELLPFGAYLIYSDQCPRPIKVLTTD